MMYYCKFDEKLQSVQEILCAKQIVNKCDVNWTLSVLCWLRKCGIKVALQLVLLMYLCKFDENPSTRSTDITLNTHRKLPH